MRYAIFSDIHSNLEAFSSCIDACKKESVDRYLCIGDVVGYAADPAECIDLVKNISQITVAGNHDWGTVNLFSMDYFNPTAAKAVIWTRNNLKEDGKCFLESLKLTYKNDDLTIVHGSLNSPEDFNYMLDTETALETFKLMENNICFVGHTHVAGLFTQDKSGNIAYSSRENIDIEPQNKYIVNVGSVGQPRDNNPKSSYCLYDTDKKQAYIKRVDYDIAAARKKIIEARLPSILGDRLLLGR